MSKREECLQVWGLAMLFVCLFVCTVLVPYSTVPLQPILLDLLFCSPLPSSSSSALKPRPSFSAHPQSRRKRAGSGSW